MYPMLRRTSSKATLPTSGSRPGQLLVLNYYEPANDYIYSRVAWFKLLGLGHTLHTARASLRLAVQHEGLYNSTKAMLTEDLPK